MPSFSIRRCFKEKLRSPKHSTSHKRPPATGPLRSSEAPKLHPSSFLTFSCPSTLFSHLLTLHMLLSFAWKMFPSATNLTNICGAGHYSTPALFPYCTLAWAPRRSFLSALMHISIWYLLYHFILSLLFVLLLRLNCISLAPITLPSTHQCLKTICQVDLYTLQVLYFLTSMSVRVRQNTTSPPTNGNELWWGEGKVNLFSLGKE